MATTFTAKIIKSGRITIPKPVRDKLGLKEGDNVQFSDCQKLIPEAQ